MEKLYNLKKGDTVAVAIERGSNAARGVTFTLDNIDEWTYLGKVITISKKYITVSFGSENAMKFVVEDSFRNKYNRGGADYKLYDSIDTIYKNFKAEKLYNNIKSKFSSYENIYPLELLEEISKLLDSN